MTLYLPHVYLYGSSNAESKRTTDGDRSTLIKHRSNRTSDGLQSYFSDIACQPAWMLEIQNIGRSRATMHKGELSS